MGKTKRGSVNLLFLFVFRTRIDVFGIVGFAPRRNSRQFLFSHYFYRSSLSLYSFLVLRCYGDCNLASVPGLGFLKWVCCSQWQLRAQEAAAKEVVLSLTRKSLFVMSYHRESAVAMGASKWDQACGFWAEGREHFYCSQLSFFISPWIW